MSISKLKVGAASTVGGVVLVGAGLLFGTSLAGAQTPSPTTPSTPQQEQTTPAPRNDGTKPECDDGDRQADGSSGSGSATSGRSGGNRGAAIRY